MFDVASDGDHLVYQADPTHNGGGESEGNGLGSAYLATHSATGWTQTSIQPAGRRVTQYHGFSSDMSVGVMTSESERAEYEVPQLPGDQIPRGRYGEIYSHSLDKEIYQPLFSRCRLTMVWHPLWSDNGYTDLDFQKEVIHFLRAVQQTLVSCFSKRMRRCWREKEAWKMNLTDDVKTEIVNKEDFDYLYDSMKGSQDWWMCCLTARSRRMQRLALRRPT